MPEPTYARARAFLRAIGVDEQTVDLSTYRHDGNDTLNRSITARWRDIFEQEHERVVPWSVIQQVMAEVEPKDPEA